MRTHGKVLEEVGANQGTVPASMHGFACDRLGIPSETLHVMGPTSLWSGGECLCTKPCRSNGWRSMYDTDSRHRNTRALSKETARSTNVL